MRRTSRCLIIFQTLGMEIATLLVLIEIRTLFLSEVLLGAVGLLIAYISFGRSRPFGLCFGLACANCVRLLFLTHLRNWLDGGRFGFEAVG